MIHQPLAGMEGTAEEILIHAKEFGKVKERLNRILLKHTGHPLEKIEKDTDRDRFMSAEEAMEYGLIDQVIEHMEPPKPTDLNGKRTKENEIDEIRNKFRVREFDCKPDFELRISNLKAGIRIPALQICRISTTEGLMKIWQIVVPGLLGLALAGCRNDPSIALLERDNPRKSGKSIGCGMKTKS